MQAYIGICDNHDSGACLFNGDELVFAVNEERLSREKLTREFPMRSLLKIFRISKGPANIIISSEMTPIFLLRIFNKFYSGIKSRSQFSYFLNLYILYQLFMKQTGVKFIEKYLSTLYFRHKLSSRFKGKIQKLAILDHHLSHSSGAFRYSGMKNALIISCDAMGDGISLMVSTANGSKITKVHEELGNSGISVYYSRITEYLGFKALRHEGKILGLAAYGNPEKTQKIMRQMLNFQQDGSFNRLNHLIPVSKRLGLYGSLKKFSREDIAAGLQRNLETEFVKFVRYWLKKTGNDNLCLSGGLFSNVKLNQRIKEDSGVKEIFIFPHMGDGGLAVSSAVAHLKSRPKKLKNLYLGPEFSDEYIKSVLERFNLNYYKPKDRAKKIAQLLKKGNLIGLFDGRMEYGPRALGNRSILCRPDDHKLSNLLNSKLKRNEFMPFAPSVLYDHRKKCFEDTEGAEYAAKFMAITFNCTDWMKKNCPAVIHVDGTCRPQLLEKRDNPKFFHILEEFYKLSGLPCVINTSFNIHEEPIICSPEDALRSFKIADLDYLCIGDYLVANQNEKN